MVKIHLVDMDGSPLTIHGQSQAMLELEKEGWLPANVVFSCPLTTEVLLGLDILVDQQVSIDLTNQQLRLADTECIFPD